MGTAKQDGCVGDGKRSMGWMDCVVTVSRGRTGQIFNRTGVLNSKKASHAEDPRPLDENCNCPACSNYSRAYLHHVFRSQEMISGMLLTWHNLRYFQDIMAGMIEAISTQTFTAWEADFHSYREQGDIYPLSIFHLLY